MAHILWPIEYLQLITDRPRKTCPRDKTRKNIERHCNPGAFRATDRKDHALNRFRRVSRMPPLSVQGPTFWYALAGPHCFSYFSASSNTGRHIEKEMVLARRVGETDPNRTSSEDRLLRTPRREGRRRVGHYDSSKTCIYRLLYVKPGHTKMSAALNTRDRKTEVLRLLDRNPHGFCCHNKTQTIIAIDVGTHRRH